MRKVKKINGYLIVRFNDREKRDYPELGSFGIIDAEQYTGNLNIDRGVMEYDDADTIEVAVEQARGLESEKDFTEEPPTYTVIIEDGGCATETEFKPQLLIKGWEAQLEGHIKSSHYKDVDPRTAAHELYGYKTALCDLGLINHDARAVDPDHFAPGMMEQPLPKNSEELLAHICDNVCRHPDQAESQEKLDRICAECVVGRLMGEASDRDLHIVTKAKGRLDGLIHGLAETPNDAEAKRLEREVRTYLEALTTTKTLTMREVAIYDAAITEAVLGRPEFPPTLTPQEVRELRNFRGLLKEMDDHASDENTSPKHSVRLEMKVSEGTTLKAVQEALNAADSDEPPREGFRHFPGTGGALLDGNVYQLGLEMETKCPENDCIIYRNVSRMARALDEALDGAQGYVAEVLRQALGKHVRELWQMYYENYAVKAFREEENL